MVLVATYNNWREDYEHFRHNRFWLSIWLTIYAAAWFLTIVWALHHHQPWLVGLGMTFGNGGAEILAMLWEGRGTKGIFDFKKQSWAAMADLPSLVTSSVFTALVWPSLHHNWFTGLFIGGHWWIGLCVAAFFAWGGAWNFRRTEYNSYDYLQFFSPSKLVHDRLIIPILAGISIYGKVPVLVFGWASRPWLTLTALLTLLIWVIAFVADAVRLGLPDDHEYKLTGDALHRQTNLRGKVIELRIKTAPTLARIKKLGFDEAVTEKQRLLDAA